jgi:hypothetical protein
LISTFLGNKYKMEEVSSKSKEKMQLIPSYELKSTTLDSTS